jgi:hypothetical protein
MGENLLEQYEGKPVRVFMSDGNNWAGRAHFDPEYAWVEVTHTTPGNNQRVAVCQRAHVVAITDR